MSPTTFIPRAIFPTQLSLPRSYYLGHHASGLAKMRTLLGGVDLVLECRDYRVPLTSRNPAFETALAGIPRIIVYTKYDLGTHGDGGGRGARHDDLERDATIRAWHAPFPVLFSAHASTRSAKAIIATLRERSVALDRLTGTRALIVGMPNVGKSSLVNALRLCGTGGGKAAATGAQPGITRKVASAVKVICGDEGALSSSMSSGAAPVYVLDTPGVFVPYVADAEAMLKLALVGAVKDTLVSPVVLADYLLFALNRRGLHGVYEKWSGPTNDVAVLLECLARATGRLRRSGHAMDRAFNDDDDDDDADNEPNTLPTPKTSPTLPSSGTPDLEASALWLIQRWRRGQLGRMVLDEVDVSALARVEAAKPRVSLSAARRAGKDAQRARGKERAERVRVRKE